MIITLEEAKNLLRVDFEEDNGLIQTLINTIPQYLENKTGRP
ncbi:phage gp6-like head-tail connector protein [Clostridium botulinum]|nr:phage gp6-like head-tail connector protein [Clostridium botulinum]NFI60317.1 phage gp6-like head-tail connector protein [Clostridium botulinum]NFI71150.1 phage gp6-like head-tail connector protein [Clostridium botulinum]NFI88769.1 phage gp6-like head-tail connector protein [Clostridium botulinum]NFI91264.1 phage gp6-like head-tail connector protein [Clostridium botulinum]